MGQKSKANQTSFKIGNPGGPGRGVGTLSVKTIAKQFIRKTITKLEDVFDEAGIQQLMDEIEGLPERERVAAKLTLLEYVKPKLSRLEMRQGDEMKVISIFGMPVGESRQIEDIPHEDVTNNE